MAICIGTAPSDTGRHLVWKWPCRRKLENVTLSNFCRASPQFQLGFPRFARSCDASNHRASSNSQPDVGSLQLRFVEVQVLALNIRVLLSCTLGQGNWQGKLPVSGAGVMASTKGSRFLQTVSTSSPGRIVQRINGRLIPSCSCHQTSQVITPESTCM